MGELHCFCSSAGHTAMCVRCGRGAHVHNNNDIILTKQRARHTVFYGITTRESKSGRANFNIVITMRTRWRMNDMARY